MGKINDSLDRLIMNALKNKEGARVNAYRNLKTKFMEFRTDKARLKDHKVLDDSTEISIIQKQVKELQNDIEVFTQNNRIDLVLNASCELTMLKEFLPAETPIETIEAYVRNSGIELVKCNMGVLMKLVRSEFSNVDGGKVAAMLNKILE